MIVPWTLLFATISLVDAKTIPRSLIDMLGNVNDFDSFIDIFSMREELKNFTAENTRMRNNDAGTVAKLENQVCKPRPVLVEVSQPNDATTFRYPFYVTLYRCMGSCGANPFLARCGAAEIEPLQLRVAQIGWGNKQNEVSKSAKIVLLPVHNETRCNCECKNKVEGCNRFQVWEENSCRCECTGYCPRNYVFSGGFECCSCQQRLSCSRKKFWNVQKCACECKKKFCKNQLKSRDAKSCKCVCKEDLCRYGYSMDPKTCLCGRRNTILY